MQLNYADLVRERVKLVEDARAILDRAVAAKRSLTAAEQAEFDRLDKRVSEIKAITDRGAIIDEEERHLAQPRPRKTQMILAGQDRLAGAGDVVLRSNETFAQRFGGGPAPERRVGLDTLIRAAFGRGSAEERAAISGAIGADGSVLVPSYLAPTILDAAFEESVLVRAGALRVAMTERTHTLPRITADPQLGWRAELGTVDEQKEPGIGVAVLTAKSLAGVAVVSMEVLEDASGLEAAVTRSFGRAIARAFDKAALQGGGTHGPASLFADTAIEAASTVFADWSSLADIAADLATAEGGELDFIVLDHARIATLRKAQASTAGTWLGPPPGLESVRLLGSAQADAEAEYLLVGSRGSAVAIGMLNEIRFLVLREHYAVNQPYPAGGSAIGGGVGLAVFARGDVVAVEPGRLLKVPTSEGEGGGS